MDEEELIEQQEQQAAELESSKKTLKTAAQGVATAYGGKLGGKVVDGLSKTKLGDRVLTRGAKRANKNRRFRNAAQKLDNSGALDAANNALSPSGAANNSTTTQSKSNTNQKSNISSTTATTSKSGLPQIKLTNPLVLKLILILLPITVILLMLIVIFVDDEESSSGGLATSGYYAMRCEEVTVIMTDKSKGYEVTGTGTYALEDYVAGVVSAEVGMFNNLEVYKEFALAARTYFLTHDDNCTIESSDRKQVFRDITDRSVYPYADLIYQAVEETKGQVLLSNNELFSVGYDAFCSIAVDDNYYTIKQANQKIPRSWVDSQSGISESWKQGTCAGNHGRGLSQWGSYYLATEQGLKHNEILEYYLSDNNITISTGSFMSSIAGLEIKDTTNATELHQNLSSYLAANGSSIETLNAAIHDNVIKNGAGSRAGVVTAAVSLVNFLYDGGHIRIPYYWGGKYQHIGVDPNFGSQTSASTSSHGSTFYYSGFDCSGFASWAIRNGGYNFSRHTTATFHSAFSGDSCDIGNSSCIGQPGDLINSNGCHVQMIVSVDESSQRYYVAESTGSYGLIIRPWNMHSGNCGNTPTRILHLDNFYNNRSNVDNNY